MNPQVQSCFQCLLVGAKTLSLALTRRHLGSGNEIAARRARHAQNAAQYVVMLQSAPSVKASSEKTSLDENHEKILTAWRYSKWIPRNGRLNEIVMALISFVL